MTTVSQLVERAAAPTLERIRRDCERAPVKVRPLLEHVKAHLFDPDLDVKRLKLACGVRDNTVEHQFQMTVNLPPSGYILDCRMVVACRLLEGTDLKVWQIAQQLGYSSVQVFSRAFDRWAGMRPTEFRKEFRGDPPPGTREQGRTMDAEVMENPRVQPLLRRALEGDLSFLEARLLSVQIVRAYPRSCRGH